mgnify:CR=1 FL=1
MKKRKRIVSSNANYVWLPEYGTKTTQPSVTVPGESYTIHQLFERANAGVPMDFTVKVREGYFDNPEDFDGFAPEAVDIVDLHEQKEASIEIIKDAKQKLSDVKKTDSQEAKRTPKLKEVSENDSESVNEKKSENEP